MTVTKRAGTAAAVVLFTILMFNGPASAQSTDGLQYCGPTVGYSDNCPDDVERPSEVAQPAAGSLARTGANSFPLARIAIVLIAVGGALTVMGGRKRLARQRS